MLRQVWGWGAAFFPNVLPSSQLFLTVITEEPDIILPLHFVLSDQTVLPYFQEFLSMQRGEHVLEFWHLAESFPKNCSEKIKRADSSGDPDALVDVYVRLQEDALRLFYQFVADEAPSRVELPLNVVSETHHLATMAPHPPITTFDLAKVGWWGGSSRSRVMA